jgi:LysR family cys regulon transcriptional activator
MRCRMAVQRVPQRCSRSVTLNLHQGSPKQIAEMLIAGEADVGIATEALGELSAARHPALLPLDAQHCGAARARAAAHARGRSRSQQLAAHPIITYDTGYNGRTQIDRRVRG